MRGKVKRFISFLCALMLCMSAVTASVYACKKPAQHDKEESTSYTTSKEFKERNDPKHIYRYVYANSNKWICGYASGQPSDGVYIRKGQHAYYNENKTGGSISVSIPLGYGGVSFGSVSVSVPIGKTTSNNTAWPTNNAGKNGYYKVYVHKYYRVVTACKEIKKYNSKTKKYYWDKYGKPHVTNKTLKAIKAVLIAQ